MCIRDRCHCIVVTEYNFYLIAILSKSVCNDLLCLILLPVTNLIGEAFNLKTCIGKSLYGILGTILGINVLRITFYHNVLDFSIAV